MHASHIPPMVAFRVDASVKIGTGHVMRCLTLANELREHGVATHFICRAHAGHMAERIMSEAHELTLLPDGPSVKKSSGDGRESSKYASWLGADWMSDASETARAVENLSLAWLVVDHYAIDLNWERWVKAATGAKVMVIDGLADRLHDCDLLLDQTYSPEGEQRWDGIVSKECKLFVGPRFSLIRPEFAAARKMMRQRNGNVRRIFISFGGVDEQNATMAVLDAILELGLSELVVDVVVGGSNPHGAQVDARCRQLKNVNAHIQPGNVAEIMANADLAISAGGTQLMEQCYLHLPSIVVSIADNQIKPAQALHDLGAVFYAGNFGAITKESIKQSILQLMHDLPRMMNMQLLTEKLMMAPEITVSQALLRNL